MEVLRREVWHFCHSQLVCGQGGRLRVGTWCPLSLSPGRRPRLVTTSSEPGGTPDLISAVYSKTGAPEKTCPHSFKPTDGKASSRPSRGSVCSAAFCAFVHLCSHIQWEATPWPSPLLSSSASVSFGVDGDKHPCGRRSLLRSMNWKFRGRWASAQESVAAHRGLSFRAVSRPEDLIAGRRPTPGVPGPISSLGTM